MEENKTFSVQIPLHQDTKRKTFRLGPELLSNRLGSYACTKLRPKVMHQSSLLLEAKWRDHVSFHAPRQISEQLSRILCQVAFHEPIRGDFPPLPFASGYFPNQRTEKSHRCPISDCVLDANLLSTYLAPSSKQRGLMSE